MGDDIPHVPNKRGGGLCLGGKIAPIFFNTMEDAGALPIEVDVSNLNMGDVIDVYPYKGEVRNHETGELLATFELKTDVLIDGSACWWPYSADYRAWPDHQSA